MGRVSNANLFVDELGCKVGSLPTTYLAMPLGAHYRAMTILNGGGRVLQEEACFMEKTIYLQGWHGQPSPLERKLETCGRQLFLDFYGRFGRKETR